MSFRKVPAAACIEWLKRAVDLGSHKPGAVFGASALYVGVLLAVVFVYALLLAIVLIASAAGNAEFQRPEMMTVFVSLIPAVLISMALSQVLSGGLIGVVAASANKQDVKATDIFRALRADRVYKLLGLLALPLISFISTLIIYRVFGGPDYISEMYEVFKNIEPGVPPMQPEAEHPILLNLVSWIVGLLIGFVTLLSLPAVMIRGEAPLSAIGQAFKAVFANAATFSLLTLVLIVGFIVLLVVVFVLALILGTLAAFVPLIGVPILLAVLLTLIVVGMVLWAAVAYFAWSDIFSEAPTTQSDTTPANQIEL